MLLSGAGVFVLERRAAQCAAPTTNKEAGAFFT